MASHKSAEKCIRKTQRQTVVNRMRTSRMRTDVKNVEKLMASKTPDFEAIRAALVAAESRLMKSAANGVIHKNTASRKISRLVRRMKQLKSA